MLLRGQIMNKKSLSIAVLLILLLTSCNNYNSLNEETLSSSNSETSISTSTSANNNSSSISGEDSSNSNQDSSSPLETIIDLGKKSIKEVKDLCYNKEYVTEEDLNSFGNGYSAKYKVTIEGLVLTRVNLVKSTKKFGLDVSSINKTILGNGSEYIAVASDDLYKKVADYVGKATSSYSVTGYLSLYLNKPEIFAISFTWEQNLKITFDSFSSSKSLQSIENFYEVASENTYNCAGHGYGDFYSLSSLKVLDKKDEQFYLTDGERIIKGICYNSTTLTIGNIYNVSGLLSLLNYSPALKIVSFEKVTDKTINNNFEIAAKSITIKELKTKEACQDDTSTKYPEFIKDYQYVYCANVYISACLENGNYYMIATDEYLNSNDYINGTLNAAANYNAALLRNNNLWKRSYDELYSDKLSYNPFRDYLNEEKTIKIYFFRWELNYCNKKTAWKIFLLSDFFPTESGE